MSIIPRRSRQLDNGEPPLPVLACILAYSQTRLAPAIHDADACVRQCRLLIETAKRLDVPVVALEQYPQGLGPTVPELRTF
jgi:hypothetical protein